MSSGRTPSVWLLPDTNRMTIRVSTVKESDVAVESFIDIPSFKWTLVTFVFSNATGSRDNGKSCSASDSISAEIVKAAANGIFLSTEAENLVSGSQSGPLNCSEIDETVEGRTWFNIKAYVNSTLDIR